MGIKGTNVTEEANAESQIPYGAYVTDVIMDSPAMLEGLQKGDIIIGLGDITIENYTDFATAMYNNFKAGQSITIKLMRPSQDTYKEMSIDVVLSGAK